MKQTVEDLFQEVQKKLEEQYQGVTCTLVGMKGNNGTTAYAVEMNTPDHAQYPLTGLDFFASQINDGKTTLEEATESITKTYGSYLKGDGVPKLNQDTARQNLYCVVIEKESNKGLLRTGVSYQDVPGTDLTLVMRFKCAEREGERASFLVRERHLAMMGLTSSEAFEVARHNTLAEGVTIRNMAEVLSEQFGMPEDMLEEIDVKLPMYVISNLGNVNGATQVFLDKSRLEEVREKMGVDTFYILPSSIHEVICVPGDMDVMQLKAMVKEVNATCVMPEERLSDNVFFCNEKLQLSMPDIEITERIQETTEHIHASVGVYI